MWKSSPSHCFFFLSIFHHSPLSSLSIASPLPKKGLQSLIPTTQGVAGRPAGDGYQLLVAVVGSVTVTCVTILLALLALFFIRKTLLNRRRTFTYQSGSVKTHQDLFKIFFIRILESWGIFWVLDHNWSGKAQMCFQKNPTLEDFNIFVLIAELKTVYTPRVRRLFCSLTQELWPWHGGPNQRQSPSPIPSWSGRTSSLKMSLERATLARCLGFLDISFLSPLVAVLCSHFFTHLS